jgi:hypothetical protein
MMNRKLSEFKGDPKEDVDDWLHSVGVEATAGNWPELVKLNMAKAALRGAASLWGVNPEEGGNWEAWSHAFAAAFRRKYTLEEWFELVKARKQKENEPAEQYALELKKLLKFCPENIAEAKFVKYAIQGIRHTQFRAILLCNQPATMTLFGTLYGEMEANVTFAPQQEGANLDTLRALQTELQQQKSKLAEFEREARMSKLNRNNSTSGQHSAPFPLKEERRSFNNPQSSTKCYDCNSTGHIARDCPKGKICFRCNKEGHISTDCPDPKKKCYRCGSPDHRLLDCPEKGSFNLDKRPSASRNASAGPQGAGPAQTRPCSNFP